MYPKCLILTWGGGGEGGKEEGGGSGFSDNMSLNIDWVGAGGLHLFSEAFIWLNRSLFPKAGNGFTKFKLSHYSRLTIF